MSARVRVSNVRGELEWKQRRPKVDGVLAGEHVMKHGEHPANRRCGTARSNLGPSFITRMVKGKAESEETRPRRPKPRLIITFAGEENVGWWPEHLRAQTRRRRAKNRIARASRKRNRALSKTITFDGSPGLVDRRVGDRVTGVSPRVYSWPQLEHRSRRTLDVGRV